jgi:succinate dehydrogenase / fumarate reductase membrane anchor subunit
MKNNYNHKWVLQRISAFFLIPLSFWFIYQCLSFQNLQYIELKLFFQSYINSFLFTVMMIAMLIHAKLGCETIVQDYITLPSKKKFFKNMINFITFLSLFSVIFAIFKMNVL